MCASGTETDKIVVARKEYKCCECKQTIKKGDKYWYFAACWPGGEGWGNYKTCLRCKNVRDLAMDKWPPTWNDEIPAFGELYEWIRESRRY